MNKTIEWKKTQPGSTEAVQFTDGMLVTADDLTTAMRYPLSVIQVLLKAYFGCGIVCGLDISDPAKVPGTAAAPAKPGAPSNVAVAPPPPPPPVPPPPPPPGCDPNFILVVEKGVALGCDGFPIEICGPLKLDLTPDPCRYDRTDKEMFIAIRRVTAAEASARPCGCGSAGGEAAQQCSRMRDHTLVQAFDEDHLPRELCRVPKAAIDESGAAGREPASGDGRQGAAAICECLKQCGDCACCDSSWVLLGTVFVGEQGLGAIDLTPRRYVKPIACICDAVGRTEKQPPTRETRTVDEVVASDRTSTS